MSQLAGHPDWLTPVPVSNTPAYDGAYDSGGSNIFQVPLFQATGYSALIVAWIPDTDQSLVVRRRVANGAFPQVQAPHQILAKAHDQCFVVIPVDLAEVDVIVDSVPFGAAVTGQLTITGVSQAVAGSTTGEVWPISSNAALIVGAGTTVNIECDHVFKGAAVLSGAANSSGLVADVFTLNSNGTYDYLAGVSWGGANQRVALPLWLPSRHVRISFTNTVGAAINVAYGLAVSG